MPLTRVLAALLLMSACWHSSAATEPPGDPGSARQAPGAAASNVPLESIDALTVDRDQDTVPDRKGAMARVRGVVTIVPGAWSDRFFQTVIQDSTGGIVLFSRDVHMSLALGDVVEAYGEVSQFRGMIQLQVVRVRRVGRVPVPAPVEVSVEEADSWKRMGQRVRTEGVAGALSLDSFGRFRLSGDEGASLSVFIPAEVARHFDWKQYPRGTRLRATGVVSIYKSTWPYDGGFQLLVTSPADLEVLQAPVPAWQVRAGWAAAASGLLLAIALLAFHLVQRRQKTRERELATLAALSAGFASPDLTQEQLARHACDILTAFAVVEAALVHVFDERGCLRQLAVSASDPKVGLALSFSEPLPPGSSPGRSQTQQIEARIAQQGLTLLAVHPLLAASGTQGFLIALSPHRRRPSHMQGRTLQSAVKLLAMALEIRRNQERAQVERQELQQLVITDELTRLYNRRFLDEYLRVQIPLAHRRGGGLAFLAIDIDHFKSINDTHGHAIGDGVLAGVAEHLRQVCRSSDLPVRVGGEEFLVVVAESDAPSAMAIAERLRAGIAAKRFVDIVPGVELQVTVSIGVSVFGMHGDTAAALLRGGDEAMYASKRSGRNRVTLAAHPEDDRREHGQAEDSGAAQPHPSRSSPA